MAENLGETGEKLRLALENPADGYEMTVLILEAARVADRLDQLDRILTGNAEYWARVMTGRDGELEIRVDGVLQEARQQAGTLRQLLAEIHRQRGGDGPEVPEDDLAGL